MDRIRAWFGRQEYQAIDDGIPEDGDARPSAVAGPAFSWLEYSIFVLLGISMLWAWNMFLAAGPYLEQRFHSSAWIAKNFQAAELSASTVGTLGMTLVLTNMQKGASYSRRIFVALVLNSVVFTLLAISTKVFTSVTASSYFGFIIAMVLSTSVATGFFQNGIFAFVSGFGQSRYTQGIMVGQGIAGVLPCVAQIGLVLALVPNAPPVPDTAALAYFSTSILISVLTFFSFSFLVKSRATEELKAAVHNDASSDRATSSGPKKRVPFRILARKLFWLASAVFATFVITMLFPVFTQKVMSNTSIDEAPRILYPASFVPLAFLMWNIGDLIGRVLTAYPKLLLTHRPMLLFLLAILRLVWIPMYYLCNIGGKGAVIKSDFFYLAIVQVLFGISNGYIGSSCMMGAADWVEPEEREAAGGFMGLCLVLGLAVGSLLSFFVSG
ncbi:nucleoside transporter-domain-containing protein [Elsinoe ampelina]|uniref:Nucleoside transporter-domain-containing protein n=1 Tax=Elsinoe ampelina TaxID=302913 RepID=A0A6A6GHG5_9PEZI|nr:nucleoside transporter-domain-containing protein [Elsinoe ampelina]